MSRIAAILFLCVGVQWHGGLSDLAHVRSPDGAYSATARLVSADELRPKLDVPQLPETRFAALLLRDCRFGKLLHQITIPDADDTDSRNESELSWGPSGNALVVQTQIGRISQFTLHRIAVRKLAEMAELPIPKHLLIHPKY